MSEEELKVFYLLDKQNYLVECNAVLAKILDVLEYKYSEEDIQNYIDKLISWYLVKYSDQFLSSLFDEEKDTDMTILDIMDVKTLRKSYGAFEEDLFSDSLENNAKIILQKHLIVMAGWGLIYYRKSNPKFGFYRATKLLDDFNGIYSWNLSSNVYLPVLEKDYSLGNEENKKLLDVYTANKKKKKLLFSK